MKLAIIARLSLGNFDVQAGGKTREEAIQNCLDKARKLIACDVIDTDTGFRLPERVFAKMPQSLPAGCVRVCFVRHSHSDGHPYDYRHVAVPKDSRIVVEGGRKPKKFAKDGKISFVDCNANYHYDLPPGSYLWQDGVWVETQRVEYDY